MMRHVTVPLSVPTGASSGSQQVSKNSSSYFFLVTTVATLGSLTMLYYLSSPASSSSSKQRHNKDKNQRSTTVTTTTEEQKNKEIGNASASSLLQMEASSSTIQTASRELDLSSPTLGEGDKPDAPTANGEGKPPLTTPDKPTEADVDIDFDDDDDDNNEAGEDVKPINVDEIVWTFAEAAHRIKVSKHVKVSDADKLVLYGLYKQATQGNVGARGLWTAMNPIENAKYQAWQANLDMTKADAENNYIDKVKQLLTPPKTTPEEKTASVPEQFFDAAGSGNLAALKKLLEEDKDLVEHRDENGQTALHMAADTGALDAVKFLISQKANVAAADETGISVLQAAVISGHVAIVKYLLEEVGADPDQEDDDGDSPRSCALDDGNAAMVALFYSGDDDAAAVGVNDQDSLETKDDLISNTANPVIMVDRVPPAEKKK